MMRAILPASLSDVMNSSLVMCLIGAARSLVMCGITQRR